MVDVVSDAEVDVVEAAEVDGADSSVQATTISVMHTINTDAGRRIGLRPPTS